MSQSTAPSPSSESRATASTADRYALDPVDAAFVARPRDEGLVPAGLTFPDAVLAGDAQAICTLLAIGEEFDVQQVDLVNMRESRASMYGITAAKAGDVMVFVGRELRPAQVATIKTALA